MSNPTSPIRFPGDAPTPMMNRRAGTLLVLGFLIPGTVQLLAGNRRFGRFAVRSTFVLWAIVAIGLVTYLLSRAVFVTAITNSAVLVIAQIGIAFYGLLWIAVALDTARLLRWVRLGGVTKVVVAVLAISSLVVVGGASAYGFIVVGATMRTLDAVFSGGQVTPPINGRYNILLLGGDAGPDRAGLRPDSISVVSIDAATGQATIIGVPRDLQNFVFPTNSPLAAEYPNGYGVNGCQVDVCLLNSVYTEVQLKTPQLYPGAVAKGSQPGIEGMRDAVQGALGITLQYYVLIDMQGFSDLIDKLGGLTIDSPGRYPLTDKVDANGQPYTPVPWIEPGVQHMDGFTALWYARIRAGSSDYDRMARQRQVQEAILQQITPANVLSNFEAVAKAGTQVVSTDIPQAMLGYFVDLADKSRVLPVNKLELVPPLVQPANPNFADIHSIVAATLAVSTATPTPAG